MNCRTVTVVPDIHPVHVRQVILVDFLKKRLKLDQLEDEQVVRVLLSYRDQLGAEFELPSVEMSEAVVAVHSQDQVVGLVAEALDLCRLRERFRRRCCRL